MIKKKTKGMVMGKGKRKIKDLFLSSFFLLFGIFIIILGLFYDLDERWGFFFMGFDFTIMGLGWLLILIYYYITQYKKKIIKLDKNVSIIWYLCIVHIVFGLIWIFTTPDPQIQWIGYVLLFLSIYTMILTFFLFYYRDKRILKKLKERNNI